MNRLVIIGNGFDLAHGLPTRYKDFINDFWRNLKSNSQNNLVKKIVTVNDQFSGIFDFEKIDSYQNFKNSLIKYSKTYNIKVANNSLTAYTEATLNNRIIVFKFKNELFRVLCEESSIEHWVDIENVYYNILKDKAVSKIETLKYPHSIEKLNEEFNDIKELLEEYLIEKVVNVFDLDFTKNQNIDWNKIYNFLKPISLLTSESNIMKEFINSKDVKEIKEHFEKERSQELINNVYFLNFNYTPIAYIYSNLLSKDDRIETTINFIHGELGNNKENKINFGFGDEMDDDYKMIEKLDDNEFLRNFKSFQYLQNSNYSNLLNYIDSDKFQVLIMGHSCGLSDRTLLNTIFEHTNCRSIKVFYHQKDDDTDNYTEIIQNISRHFNKKALMREKIVNKTLCKPLPQIQLPKK